jgi:lysophospholipase L1-like esterase
MKTPLHVCFAALCSLLSARAQDGAKPSTSIATQPALHDGTEKRIESFNEISRKGEAALVFLGDSITQGWEGPGKAIWQSTWAPLKAANFGISGDRTEHVLWRLDHGNGDGLKPKLVVLMIGTNNTGHRKAEEPAAETAAGVKAITDRLHAKFPDSRILILGIFPRDEKPTARLRAHNTAINELLKPLADNQKVHFLDIGRSFLQPDGTLSREIMPDFLHLSSKGYQIWADAIRDKVAELMK